MKKIITIAFTFIISVLIVTSALTSEDTETKNGYKNLEKISLDESWQYADSSVINHGEAVMYTATANRKDIIVAVNAGHGTKGGTSVKTYCHPERSRKVTGGTTAQITAHS